MMRKTFAIAATTGMLGSTVLVGATSAAADCQLQRLPAPDGATGSEVSAGSPSGTWLAGSARFDVGGSKPLLWHQGEVRQPNVGVPEADLQAISSNGRTVGFGFRNDGEDTVSFAHQNGTTWRLPTLTNGGDATVRSISPNGRTAVGFETVSTDGMQARDIAVRWTGKRLQNVQKVAGASEAHGVDRGTVVGSSRDRAYVWPRAGKPGLLPKAATPSVAEAVRGKYAVGEESPADDTTGSVMLWNLERSTATKLPQAVNDAYDVNSSGAAAVSTGEDVGGDAAVVEDRRMRTLPSLGGGGSATTISDAGAVAGTTYNADGEARAVVWRGCGS